MCLHGVQVQEYLRYRNFPARLATARREEVEVMKVCFISDSLWVVGASIEKWMRRVRASNLRAVKAARSFDQLAMALKAAAAMDDDEIIANGDQSAPHWEIIETDVGICIRWYSQWTNDRWLDICLVREPKSGAPAAITYGCTGTGKESSLFADIFAGWMDAIKTRHNRRRYHRPPYLIHGERWARPYVDHQKVRVWVNPCAA